MLTSYKTVFAGGVKEIIIEKSKFIATVSPIQSEEEAITFIDSMKKKYKDANHNCYAYVLGDHNEIRRCSDDGEPSKTAGVPMLDVLLLEKIHNVAVVVTRYFGGVLLGTGGLVRAYQSSCKEGLSASTIIEKSHGQLIEVITDYNGIGKLQHIISSMDLITKSTDYTDIVRFELIIPPNLFEEFRLSMMEASNGKASISHLDTIYYAKVQNEILLFDGQ